MNCHLLKTKKTMGMNGRSFIDELFAKGLGEEWDIPVQRLYLFFSFLWLADVIFLTIVSCKITIIINCIIKNHCLWKVPIHQNMYTYLYHELLCKFYLFYNNYCHQKLLLSQLSLITFLFLWSFWMTKSATSSSIESFDLLKLWYLFVSEIVI